MRRPILGAGAALLLLVGAAVLLWLAACAGTPSPTPSPPEHAGPWFVEVDGEGGVWLGPETLRRLGLDPAQEAAPAVRLSRAGDEIPVLPISTSEGWGLWFFAPDRSTRYTRRTALRLEPGIAGRTMDSTAPPEARSSPAAGLVTVRWEQDLRYLPQARAEAPWFWERVVAPGSVEYSVTLTEALPGPVTATLHLWSHTFAAPQPDHRLRLSWDGQTVGEWEWEGQTMQHLTASWEQADGEPRHTLAVELPGLPEVDLEMVWLDGWEISYRRPAEAGGTVWRATRSSLQVGDAGPDWRMLDITDDLQPLDLGPVPAGGVVGSVPGHRYWLGVPQEAPGPLQLRPARELDLEALQGVEYLALAPPDLQPPLEPLMEHRRAEGLAAAMADPQAVYDVLGTGRPDPEPLQALVRALPALRYLLVVGDGASEPWGYDGEAGALRIVVPVTRTAALAETPADGLLGTDGQGQFAVAVGRLPAVSPEQVATMVEKTLQWEAQQSPPSILLLNDDEPQFATMTAEIADLLPEGQVVQRIEVGEGAGREEVLAALQQGPVWFNFSGHGSPTRLVAEGTLTLEDGEAWRQPAVVVAWTCLAAHFIHPTQDSLAEVWLRSPQGGVAAFLGPVGETTTSEQQPFALAFYQATLEGKRLGDAWLAALQTGGWRDVAVGYVLLGDPALKLFRD